MKKILNIFLLSLTLLISFLPGRALTPRQIVEFDYEGMRYEFLSNTFTEVALITPYDSITHEYSNYNGDVIIPDSVMWNGSYYPVSAIWHGFSMSNLTGLHIPNSVKGIGLDTFVGCEGLDSINLPTPITISFRSIEGCSFSKYYYRENPDGPADEQTIFHPFHSQPLEIIDVASVKKLVLRGFEPVHARKLYIHHIDSLSVMCDYVSDYTILDDTVPPGVVVEERNPEYYEPHLAPAPECILFVPDGTEDLYSEAPFWKDFSKIYPKSKLEEIEGELSGINIVETSDETGKMTVAAEGCMIRVSNAEGECSVYDIQGRMISSFRTDGSPVSLRMQPGVYIVVCGGQSAKVICR